VDQSLLTIINPIFWFFASLEIKFPNLNSKKYTTNQPITYALIKGKCLTGMAHYSPFAFSVNKKSIAKILNFTGELNQ
jgi:hypothetical protein